MKRELSIAPSLLAADFSRAGEELKAVAAAGCDYIHLDVMDGLFVPNMTFGPKFIKDLKKESDLIFDTHLMIEKPENTIDRYLDAGADIITVHEEATVHLQRCLSLIRDGGASAGVAINPGTPVSALDAVLGDADIVLVMTVNPGWGGQKFIPSTLEKIRQLEERRRRNGYSYRIEVDGGINRETVRLVYSAGATMAVMGSAFFRERDREAYVSSVLEGL